jgi:hypothetical protein
MDEQCPLDALVRLRLWGYEDERSLALERLLLAHALTGKAATRTVRRAYARAARMLAGTSHTATR